MRLRRFKALIGATLLCVSAGVLAHRFHAGMVDISFNARSGSTELVHTYMAHDVENLLANLYGRQFDLTDPEDQDVLRKYVESRFWLQDQDDAKLKLRWVGMTIDSQSIVIFQEVEQTPLTQTHRIYNKVLTDFLPDQINTVNLNDAGTVRTLNFDVNHTEQPAR